MMNRHDHGILRILRKRIGRIFSHLIDQRGNLAILMQSVRDMCLIHQTEFSVMLSMLYSVNTINDDLAAPAAKFDSPKTL